MKNPQAMGGRSREGGRELLKGRDIKYIYKHLWHYFSRYKWTFLCALILTCVSGILGITGTSLAGEAIGAITGEAERGVFYYLIKMVVFYTISTVISYFLSVLMISLSQKMSSEMRKDVYDKLVTLPVGFFDKRQAGELVSTVTYDVNTVNESVANDLIQIVNSIVTVIYSFILMLTVSPLLVLVFAVTIPLSIVCTTVIGKIVRPLFRRRSATLAKMNGYAEEMIAGGRTVRTYGAEAAVTDGFCRLNDEASLAYARAEANGTMAGPTVNFVNNLSLALVNIVGAILYMTGSGLSLTGLSQFVLLSRKFSGPINQIANIYADIQSALAASERVFRLIDEQPEKPDAENAPALEVTRGEVELSRVNFGYDPEAVILKELSIKAKPGSVVAIVGPTGAGKTTVINLLMRFYDISSGQIQVDGQDIYSVTRDSLRRAYTMVLQETWLFHGTVFENVAYGKENATREEVEAVCRAAKIHSFIEALPDGYDTVLSEAAVNISKGQKQLLTIARAMLIESNMLILDEATSNVDSKTERDISDAMVGLMKGRTCFVIAHRLSTVKNADVILVVKNGAVVESGTHEQLLLADGEYAAIYRAQFDLQG